MKSKSRIILKNMEFFAHHGFLNEEQLIGNKYSVSILLELDLTKAGMSDLLKDTVDYAQIYQIVKDEMGRSSRLLEHIGQNISNTVMNKYANIEKMEVSIGKFNPPIGGICEMAEVVIVNER